MITAEIFLIIYISIVLSLPIVLLITLTLVVLDLTVLAKRERFGTHKLVRIKTRKQ